MVQGGRCINERPDEYRLGPGGDIDISGCYGESLRSFDYPIGLPTVWSFAPNQRTMSLGAWLKENGTDLIDGLWTATVSGRLDFDQDLIHSKVVEREAISERDTTGEDDSDIRSTFVLLRREIVNGIITADVLRALTSGLL